jgi:phosphotransferase family enzyme
MTEPDALERALGPIAEVRASRLETPGFSGATHTRLHVRLADGGARSLVLKLTRVADDWLSARTGDAVGREGQLLGEPALDGVWEAFACPYLAWSACDGEVGLLMEDLTAYLLPDVREPIGEEQEIRLFGAIAAMHARFWESSALGLPWLARPDQLFGLLNAATLDALAPRGFPHAVVARAHAGWKAAFARLPERVSALLREPPEALAARGAHLPRTLTHGDFKVANFALMPDRRVAAFDWAVVGAGPVATELGWHLAVNATRIAGTKEQSIARYRVALESALGRPLGQDFWTRTVENAVLAGGAMMLWSKALALDSGTMRARAEWDWWVERLAAL